METNLGSSGRVSVKVIRRTIKAPISWKIHNTLRWSFIWGWFVTTLAKVFSQVTGITTLTSELRAILIHRDGRRVDFGVLSRRMVTTAGANWLVDCWQGTLEPETMKYHGCGTGAGAEAIGETALVTECTTALNPDNIRATGTLVDGVSANVLRSVGTPIFDSTPAVIEHGLFNQSATGGGILWDRSLFTAINVVSGDSIQFTYDLTVNTGG